MWFERRENFVKSLKSGKTPGKNTEKSRIRVKISVRNSATCFKIDNWIIHAWICKNIWEIENNVTKKREKKRIYNFGLRHEVKISFATVIHSPSLNFFVMFVTSLGDNPKKNQFNTKTQQHRQNRTERKYDARIVFKDYGNQKHTKRLFPR